MRKHKAKRQPEPGQLILPDGSMVNLIFGTWNPVKYGYTPSPLSEAAPDLLKSCKELLDMLDDAERKGLTRNKLGKLTVLLARQRIARAEGKDE
jgi:hypothetical protein